MGVGGGVVYKCIGKNETVLKAQPTYFFPSLSKNGIRVNQLRFVLKKNKKQKKLNFSTRL